MTHSTNKENAALDRDAADALRVLSNTIKQAVEAVVKGAKAQDPEKVLYPLLMAGIQAEDPAAFVEQMKTNSQLTELLELITKAAQQTFALHLIIALGKYAKEIE